MNDGQKKDYAAIAINLTRQLSAMTGIHWTAKISEERGWGTVFSMIGANGMSVYVVNDYKSQWCKV